MTHLVQHIVIVGGGSAGWLTAGIIAAKYASGARRRLQVTLVESPDVKPVGVGEGTWPSMRDTLRTMGVSEADFIQECDVSFKQASCFRGWVNGKSDDVYYHPFAAPAGFGDIDLVDHWLAHHAARPFAEVVSYQPALIAQGRAPKQPTTPEWAAVANYAYHLNAGKFGQFLQRHATQNLGVVHLLDHVTSVVSAETGDIQALETANSGLIEGDLFIDCTGFASRLLGQHFEVPFISCTDSLFCDSALAMQVPYSKEDSPIASATLSTAQESGWIWDIGLPTRRGVGYVFSNAYSSVDRAERVLRKYVQQSAGKDVARSLDVRHLSINPGHRKLFWHRNCVAVGIAAGFIEPLEASALALIEMSAAMIRDDLPPTMDLMPVVADRFNERLRYRWARIIDFLKLHYVLSQREDSDFWIDNRNPKSIPQRLQEQMRLWRYRPPSRRDFWEIEEIFPSASYQYVLYGMGYRPYDRSEVPSQAAERYVRDSAQKERHFLGGLPANRELLTHIAQNGLPTV